MSGKPPDKIINRINEIKWNDWHIIDDDTIVFENIPVAGVTFDNPDGISRQEIIARLQKWEAINLVREPQNPYDKNAVAVITGMGQIGYLPREINSNIARLIDSGHAPLAKISGIYGGTNEKSYGCHIDIHLKGDEVGKSIRTKVVGMTGKNDEDNPRKEIALYDLEVGEAIWLDLDEDIADGSPIIYVSSASSGEFGRLGKKDAESLARALEKNEEAKAFVSYVGTDENDDEKPVVEITIEFN